MNRVARCLLFLTLAVLAGGGVSEAIYRVPVSRRMLARLFRRGDISVASINLQQVSASEVISEAEIDRQMALLRVQFAGERSFVDALENSGLSLGELRAEMTEHLRAGSWIERHVAAKLRVTPEDARQFYETHAAQFQQPQRYRAAHLFLAAPEGSPDELMGKKRSAIQGLAIRVLAGEGFVELVAEASEDEATKLRGGDLGYFGAERMPPEFIAEVAKLGRDQTSAPFRSHLGFHIVQVTDVLLPAKLRFEQVQKEIALTLENDKRAAAVAALTAQLDASGFKATASTLVSRKFRIASIKLYRDFRSVASNVPRFF